MSSATGGAVDATAGILGRIHGVRRIPAHAANGVAARAERHYGQQSHENGRKNACDRLKLLPYDLPSAASADVICVTIT